MARYLRPTIVTDPTELEEEAFDSFRDVFPQWEPSAGNVEVVLLRAVAQLGADLATTLSTVPDTIFRFAGRSLHGIAPVEAVSAEGEVTFTAIDAQGYTIPEETQVRGVNSAGEDVGFVTLIDAVIPAAQTTVAGVPVRAAEEGEPGNGILGFGDMIDTLAFIDSVEFTVATSGGTDREDDDTYLNRLRDELALMAPRPILPQDFATLARRIPGVFRAVAIDGLDPTVPSSGNERMVTVAAMGEDGLPVDAATRNAIQADLDARREINFVIHTVDPTPTAIDVAVTAVAWPGFDPAAVESEIELALEAFLIPVRWGVPGGLTGDQREWVNTTVVSYRAVSGVLFSVPGVRNVTVLTVEGGTVDVNLTGHAPITTPGTITVAVTGS